MSTKPNPKKMKGAAGTTAATATAAAATGSDDIQTNQNFTGWKKSEFPILADTHLQLICIQKEEENT